MTAFDESDTRSLSVQRVAGRACARARSRARPGGARSGSDVPVTEEFVMNAAVAIARVGPVRATAAQPARGARPVDLRRLSRQRRIVASAMPVDVDADAAACATLRAALRSASARDAPRPSAELADAAGQRAGRVAAGTSRPGRARRWPRLGDASHASTITRCSRSSPEPSWSRVRSPRFRCRARGDPGPRVGRLARAR